MNTLRSELCRAKYDLRSLILAKYVRLTKFYTSAPEILGVSEQTLHRFIGSGKASHKNLAYKILSLLGKRDNEYGTYFIDEEKKREKASNNKETIILLILKVEELQQKIDNLTNTISLYHKWDNGNVRK